MAAITSAAGGNWSSAATWTGGVVPGDGDTVTITHAVALTSAVTIGTSGATGTIAVTLGAAGVLTVNGGSLRLRGDLSINSGTAGLTFNAGSSLIFDGAAAARYRVTYTTGSAIIAFNGTAASRCTVYSDLSRGGLKGYFTSAVNGFQGIRVSTFTDYTDLDDGSTNGCMYCYFATNGVNFTFDNNKFTRCGKIYMNFNGGANNQFVFTNNKFFSSVGTLSNGVPSCVDARFNTAMTAGGIRRVAFNSFDLAAAITTPVDFTIEDNVFMSTISATAAAWASFRGNFVRGPASSNVFLTAYNDVINNYIMMNFATNPHGVNTGSLKDHVISDNVFDSAVATDGQGDCIITQNPNTPIAISILRNIILPDRAGATASSVGCLVTYAGNETAGRISLTVEHNTGMLGLQYLIAMGETANGTAGAIASLRSNIGWNYQPGGSTGGAGGMMGTNIGRSSDGTGIVTDLCNPANIGRNLRFNARLTYTASGNAWFTNQANGWAAAFSATPGVSDIEGDPQFADPTRNLATWDASKGGAGTYAAGLDRLVADPSLVASDLLPWVRAGFAPTNPALRGVAHDGGDIGAVPMPAPPPVATYTLTPPAPASGPVGAASGNFTVALGSGTLASPATITPSAGAGGGTFAPATVTLTDAARSATFTYTPTSAGTKTISVADDAGLTDPPPATYTAVAPPPPTGPTTYTLVGPATIDVGTPGTFTLTLDAPAGTTVTITPSDGGSGGTFAPTSPAIAPGSSSATFAYTPRDWGPTTLSVINSAGLADPAGLALVAGIALGSSGTTGETRCPDLGGFFPTAGAWWQELGRDVTADPVHPQSATLIGRYGASLCKLEMHTSDAGGGASYIGMPYNVVPDSQADLPNAIGLYTNPDQPPAVPFFPLMSIEGWTNTTRPPIPGELPGDHHAMLYERDEATGGARGLHEYNRVETPDGGATWQSIGGITYDLTTGAPGTDGYSSGDAAGLPITPLLIRYDEVARGEILHPLRLAIPSGYSTAKWAWPARACAYTGAGGDIFVVVDAAAPAGATSLTVKALRSWPSPPLLHPGTTLSFAASGVAATVSSAVDGLATTIPVDPLPGPIPRLDCATVAVDSPFGLRYRLKQSWYDANRAGYLPNVRVVVDALRTRGGIVADLTTGGLYLNGTNDARWTTDEIAQIKTIPASAFEALAPPARLTLAAPATVAFGQPITLTLGHAIPGDSKFATGVYLYRSVDGGVTWGNTGLAPDVLTVDDAHRGPFDVTYTPQAAGIHLFRADPYQDWLDPPAAAVDVVGAAADYTLSGPTSGLAGVASAPFSVALAPATTPASPVAITPSDGGSGGAFVPASVTLTDVARSAEFAYTPATAGGWTISTTSGGALADPSPIPYTAVAPVVDPAPVDPAPVGPAAAGLTLAAVEGRMVRRARGLLELAGLDAATVDAANPDLAGPIAETLLGLGYAVADPSAPTDLDLSAVPPPDWLRFFDLARINVLEECLDNVRALTEIQVGINRFALSDAARGLETTLARLRAEFDSTHVAGSSRAETACVPSNYVAPGPARRAWDEECPPC